MVLNYILVGCPCTLCSVKFHRVGDGDITVDLVHTWYDMSWKLCLLHSNHWRNWKWCKFYLFVVTYMSSVPQVNHELVIKSCNLDPTCTGVCRWLSDFSFTHLSHSPAQIKSSESQEIADCLFTIWITRVSCTVLHIYSLSSDRST